MIPKEESINSLLFLFFQYCYVNKISLLFLRVTPRLIVLDCYVNN